jgi:hypothetical protein
MEYALIAIGTLWLSCVCGVVLLFRRAEDI